MMCLPCAHKLADHIAEKTALSKQNSLLSFIYSISFSLNLYHPTAVKTASAKGIKARFEWVSYAITTDILTSKA
jgi:hypothetical protein